MSYISVDVEADGPAPGLFSMVCFGAVIVEPSLTKTFYAQTAPISSSYDKYALSISGFSREDHEKFPEPELAMQAFADWLRKYSVDHPVFVSDNVAFDWQWINYYFHRFFGRNPFGYSGRRISDLYCGMKHDARAQWKHLLRKTKHDHNPVNDARGNAEALLAMADMGLKIKLK